MKYKVGDKVKVRSDLKCEEYYGGITFNFEMNKFKGMEITIARVNYGGYYEVLETPYNFTDEMLESVEEMSAEEATKILGKICCESEVCAECPISEAKGKMPCQNFRRDKAGEVLEILKQWKADHEKKEIETEIVDLIKVMKEVCDDETCIYAYEINMSKEDANEKMKELVKKYCEKYGDKIYAKCERICRVKS